MIARMDKNNNTQQLNEKVNLEELDAKARYASKQVLIKALTVFDRVSKKLASQAQYNPMLAEALYVNQPKPDNYLAENYPNQQFQKPVTTMQIGGYAVFSIPNSNGKSRYDVANEKTGQKLVGDLHLAESANAIVKLMNKGHSFYSPQVKQILQIESNYSKYYNDAVSFSRKIKNNPVKDAILESRFIEAKNKALEIKEQLSNFTKRIL